MSEAEGVLTVGLLVYPKWVSPALPSSPGEIDELREHGDAAVHAASHTNIKRALSAPPRWALAQRQHNWARDRAESVVLGRLPSRYPGHHFSLETANNLGLGACVSKAVVWWSDSNSKAGHGTVAAEER
jgi:hypothetical protein